MAPTRKKKFKLGNWFRQNVRKVWPTYRMSDAQKLEYYRTKMNLATTMEEFRAWQLKVANLKERINKRRK